MKRIPLVLSAILLTTSLTQINGQPPKNEFPFKAVGTVTKHGPDICMAGINYDLHPAGGKKPDFLMVKSRTDLRIIGNAVRDGSTVRVEGTMMITVEHCQYVAVSRVHPITNSSEKSKTMKSELVYKVDTVRFALLKSRPPQYQIEAKGEVRTGGWSNPKLTPVVYVHPPADGIYDYTFSATPPSGPATQAITPISATEPLKSTPKGFRGVRVRAETNSKEAIIGELEKKG
jgi:hypothetical protein